MRKLVLVMVLLGLLPCAANAQSEFSGEMILWSHLSEIFVDQNGVGELQYDYELRPISARLAVGIGNNWSVEGRFVYAQLHSDYYTYSNVGHMLDFEGNVGWHPYSEIRIYAGWNQTHLERDLEVRVGRTYHIVRGTTVESGPLVGVSAKLPEDSRLIIRSSFDIFPYLRVKDSIPSDTGGFQRANYGYRAEGAVGWKFTQQFGAYGFAGYQRVTALEDQDLLFGRRNATLKTAGFGITVSF